MRIQRDHIPPTRARRHGGFALLTGLIFLVAMSVLGVTMMGVTRLETLMAGGTREANIAFQAAEAALRRAEARIKTAPLSAFDGSAGMLGQSDPEPDFFETDPNASDYAWGDAQSIGYSTDPNCPTATACYPEVPEQPRFIVKHVDTIPDSAATKLAISIVGYGQPPNVAVFRVTTKGTSRDGSAETLLQSYYGKIY
jgi:type IV pilus assembly protein PilX